MLVVREIIRSEFNYVSLFVFENWDFIESLSNLALSLKSFLTICVSVVSSKHSFAPLKLIQIYLLSTTAQLQLTGLSVLSVENREARNIDFDNVINSSQL